MQVPLSIMIIWTFAFFLTAGGAYNYKGCSPDIPSSNMLIDACRKHAYTMKHCRTDVSNALKTAAWVRIPYPFQWGIPIFHLRTSMIMIIVSLVASVDSVSIPIIHMPMLHDFLQLRNSCDDFFFFSFFFSKKVE
jgi:nucleobase transporter 1/2